MLHHIKIDDEYVRGAFNKFSDFFHMGTFIWKKSGNLLKASRTYPI